MFQEKRHAASGREAVIVTRKQQKISPPHSHLKLLDAEQNSARPLHSAALWSGGSTTAESF